jgi:hypothetical protein
VSRNEIFPELVGLNLVEMVAEESQLKFAHRGSGQGYEGRSEGLTHWPVLVIHECAVETRRQKALID